MLQGTRERTGGSSVDGVKLRRQTSVIAAAAAAVARHPVAFARAVVRLPLEMEAAARIASLPVIELTSLIAGTEQIPIRAASVESRHGWSLGAAEQFVLQALIRGRVCRTVFEIGTFNGGTTRLLAESLPDDGRVWTMDLPPDVFDAVQSPAGFEGRSVGVAYRTSPAAGKIVQLLGDSRHFDFAPYEQSADLVLVDAGHEYANGIVDTRTALRIVRSGGVVVWDDFEPYWHGLVNGICDAMEGRTFGRLAGTSLAVYSHL